MAALIKMQADRLLNTVASLSPDDRGLGSAKTFCTSIRFVIDVCRELHMYV